MKRRILILLFFTVSYMNTFAQFVQRKGTQFVQNGQALYFVGTNYWYGSLLPLQKDPKRGIERLRSELDFLQNKGITNLRIIAGAEGSGLVAGTDRIGPPIQPQQGIFDENVLEGLDQMLVEMGKRKMTAVIYLSNNWEWSGGFLQYLRWNHEIKDSIYRAKMEWDDMRDEISKFYTCEKCINDYLGQVKKVVNRVNSVTKKKYKNDPVIMAWQIANEPRPMRPAAIEGYKKFIKQTAVLIKSLDKNHLLSIGTEGYIGTENAQVFEEIHSNPKIDYLTIHIWPKNWAWYNGIIDQQKTDTIIKTSMNYINFHEEISLKLNKPLVIEEFGMPRDGHSFSPESSTQFRDQYYKSILDKRLLHKRKMGVLAGINFWAYGGQIHPIPGQLFWKKGDDYMGDPPMEQQGLYSIFNTDNSTWELIQKFMQ